MKHIKTYKIFEHDELDSIYYDVEVVLDLKDICLELKDVGFTIQFNSNDDNSVYLSIKMIGESSLLNYYWGDIDEYVQRIIDYLGNRLIKMLYISEGYGGYKGIDINKNFQKSKELYCLLIDFNLE